MLCHGQAEIKETDCQHSAMGRHLKKRHLKWQVDSCILRGHFGELLDKLVSSDISFHQILNN